MVPGPLPQPAGAHQSKGFSQFRRHQFDIELFPYFSVPMHFAIETIEVAVLVGVHVHAHRQSARTRGNDGVHKTVIQEISWTSKGSFGGTAVNRADCCEPLVSSWPGHSS